MVLQVFMATLFGRMRIENGKWVKAKLLVTRVDGVTAGFLLMIDTPGDAYDAEVYLCGVTPHYRRRGIATQMLRSEALHMRQGAELAAACLPKAHGMKKLLAKLGFERNGNARSTAPGLRGPEWFRLLKH
jgi:GNAT superfamily N-acetyltransferase